MFGLVEMATFLHFDMKTDNLSNGTTTKPFFHQVGWLPESNDVIMFYL